MMKILLAISLTISVVSFLMAILLWQRIIDLSKKRRELKGLVLQYQTINKNSLENHKTHIETLISQVKQLQKDLQGYRKQPTLQQAAQTVISTDRNSASSGDNTSEKDNKKNEKNNSSDKNIQLDVVKTIYLGINSEDMFFDDVVQEQKGDTSKFIAKMYSETEGTFELIDVERVRSASVSDSVRRIGLTSVKDARLFKIITPGKIRKEKGGWHIESPVVVEFIK